MSDREAKRSFIAPSAKIGAIDLSCCVRHEQVWHFLNQSSRVALALFPLTQGTDTQHTQGKTEV